MSVCVCGQSLQAEEEVEAFLEQLEKSVSSIKRVLCHTSVPNMKALAKMKDVKDKLEEVTDGTSSFNLSGYFNSHNILFI